MMTAISLKNNPIESSSLSDFKRSNLGLFVEKCSPNNNKKKNNNKLAMATMGSVPDPKS